jgi:predicted amidohydrolase
MASLSVEKIDYLRVGVVQTNCPWQAWAGSLRMDPSYENPIWTQIRSALAAFSAVRPRPHIILLPELAVPSGYTYAIEQICREIGCLIIAGVDYDVDHARRHVYNRAVVLIPDSWQKNEKGSRCRRIWIGKTYPAPLEESRIKEQGYDFSKEPVCYVFDAGSWGRFGVTICYDLMDIERLTMYRNRLQHLFVLAYNRDKDSFYHISEAASRLLYCNVVLCNTGFFGGTLAVAPYYAPYKRTVYRHEGQQLVASQIVEIPVKSLIEAQAGILHEEDGNQLFKNPPPGFKTYVKTKKKAISL